MKSLKTVFTALLLTCSAAAYSQKGTTMELWPKGATVVSPDTNDHAEITVYLPDLQ